MSRSDPVLDARVLEESSPAAKESIIKVSGDPLKYPLILR
jgi:hypothetical protein